MPASASAEHPLNLLRSPEFNLLYQFIDSTHPEDSSHASPVDSSHADKSSSSPLTRDLAVPAPYVYRIHPPVDEWRMSVLAYAASPSYEFRPIARPS